MDAVSEKLPVSSVSQSSVSERRRGSGDGGARWVGDGLVEPEAVANNGGAK
jgi:hypothetical protein